MNILNHTFPLDLLSEGSNQTHLDDKVVDNMKQLIVNAFRDNGVAVSLISGVIGPTVVRFELVPDKAYKLKKIRSCEESLNEAFSDYGPVRLIAPVPAKGTIVVEVPRPDRQIIRLREVLESKEFQESKAHLPIALGVDSENNTIVADLAKMPHLLIAGATGMGKSVLLYNIILSLLYRLNQADLQLVLIDPKQVELTSFERIKDLYLLQVGDDSPEVITDISKVPDILTSIDNEVQNRYNLFRKVGCRTIREYNQKIAEGKQTSNQLSHLPYIIAVVDEFTDLIVKHGKEFEIPLLHIAQKGRAVGIHVIISTQRPTTDVITGIIKANFPARIAFKVNSSDDSRTILDITGAQQLIGKGDIMFNNNCEAIKRIQGCYFDPSEIESVCEWIARHFPKDVSYLIPFTPSRDITCNHTSVAQDPIFEEAALSIVESCKSPIDFKHLIDLLKSDDDEDDFNFPKETFMKKDEYKSLDGLPDNLEISDTPYKFPYIDYNIIGEIAEIDKIINTCGFINFDVADIESTLSKDAVNYVVVGLGQGEECMADALKEAIGKLPFDVDCISKLLFNTWIPRDVLYSVKYLNSLSEFVKGMSQDLDIYWGYAYDESLSGQQVKVTLIAASK